MWAIKTGLYQDIIHLAMKWPTLFCVIKDNIRLRNFKLFVSHCQDNTDKIVPNVLGQRRAHWNGTTLTQQSSPELLYLHSTETFTKPHHIIQIENGSCQKNTIPVYAFLTQ